MEELHERYRSAAEKARIAALEYENAMLVDMLKRLWPRGDEPGQQRPTVLADPHVTHAPADYQPGPVVFTREDFTQDDDDEEEEYYEEEDTWGYYDE